MRSFIAVLAVAALACAIAVPASAMPTDNGQRVVPNVRHAAPVAPVGDDATPAYVIVAQAPEHGSGGKDPARANVYVPPSPDTATRQGERWLQTHPLPQDLPDPHKTADVYVPPAQALSSAPDSLAPTATIAHPAMPAADDGASPWAVLGLALGCAALLGGAGLVLVQRRRARRTVA